MKSMIEIVYKENKEQANGNEGYFHLPKNIRQVGDTNGRERIYLEDYVGTFLKNIFPHRRDVPPCCSANLSGRTEFPTFYPQRGRDSYDGAGAGSPGLR